MFNPSQRLHSNTFQSSNGFAAVGEISPSHPGMPRFNSAALPPFYKPPPSESFVNASSSEPHYTGPPATFNSFGMAPRTGYGYESAPNRYSVNIHYLGSDCNGNTGNQSTNFPSFSGPPPPLESRSSWSCPPPTLRAPIANGRYDFQSNPQFSHPPPQFAVPQSNAQFSHPPAQCSVPRSNAEFPHNQPPQYSVPNIEKSVPTASCPFEPTVYPIKPTNNRFAIGIDSSKSQTEDHLSDISGSIVRGSIDKELKESLRKARIIRSSSSRSSSSSGSRKLSRSSSRSHTRSSRRSRYNSRSRSISPRRIRRSGRSRSRENRRRRCPSNERSGKYRSPSRRSRSVKRSFSKESYYSRRRRSASTSRGSSRGRRSPCSGSDDSRSSSRRPRDRRRSRNDSRCRRSPRSRSRSKYSSSTSRYTSSSRSVDSSQKSKDMQLKNGIRRRDGTANPSMSDERREMLEKWRWRNCRSDEELRRKLEKVSSMSTNNNFHDDAYWISSAPALTYYEKDDGGRCLVRGTPKLTAVCDEFEKELISKCREIRKEQEKSTPAPPDWRSKHNHHCTHTHRSSSSSSSSSSDDEGDLGNEESQIMNELERKMKHPFRLHRELWHNEPGEMNDGPLCKCSIKARRSGIRHGIYIGESENNFRCDPNSNNADTLYHYRLTISPTTNFLLKMPTLIEYDSHEYLFEGFSLLSHYELPDLPLCKVIRFNIEYTIFYVKETFPENFTIRECDLFFDYLYRELLELLDLDLYGTNEKCPIFHFMPRFVRELPEEGHELLPMIYVMKYLLSNHQILVPDDTFNRITEISSKEWNSFVDEVKGMIVTKPGMKPAALRLDYIDKQGKLEEDVENANSAVDESGRKKTDKETKPAAESDNYPVIIHFGARPPQLSYAGNQEYQKAWREFVKHRHLVANLAKPTVEDKNRLKQKEINLQKMRSISNMKRDVTKTVSSKGFYKTGLMCDVVQHAMLVPVIAGHLRFHRSLDSLEERIKYKFKNRSLLQLALTHPSYRENFGTNPDHARNSLTNCGIRQPEFGDRSIHYMRSKKRGINTLIKIMSRFGRQSEKESRIHHNERLEFLGDAVVEFSATIHLFFVFKDLEEGGLATYRAGLVQNQYLAVLAQNLQLDSFLLFAHGSDLCHDLELKHALANCFEALMGALFLDGGIEVANRVFGETTFGDDPSLLQAWNGSYLHPVQEQEPEGDRGWIDKIDYLKTLTEFEEASGITFRHIRLLARAFTDKSVGYTNLTMGSNQRLEFLGDSVLQLVASEYLYRYFPDHHEGHLSLLRSSLVNNKTQACVCDELDMTFFARYSSSKTELKMKDKADLLEAFLGALFVDKRDLRWIRAFCDVSFFPRLRDFIMHQDWNDPKSKLQQCSLTLRKINGGEPDIPHYKVIECKGPTNSRIYTVAVYFRNERLATATGNSIQQAEMNAAQAAMKSCKSLFPQLDQQRFAMTKDSKQKTWNENYERDRSISQKHDDSVDEKKRAEDRRRNSQRRSETEREERRHSGGRQSPIAKNDKITEKRYSVTKENETDEADIKGEYIGDRKKKFKTERAKTSSDPAGPSDSEVDSDTEDGKPNVSETKTKEVGNDAGGEDNEYSSAEKMRRNPEVAIDSTKVDDQNYIKIKSELSYSSECLISEDPNVKGSTKNNFERPEAQGSGQSKIKEGETVVKCEESPRMKRELK